LFADRDHYRIVVADLNAKTLDVLAGKSSGFKDGHGDVSLFSDVYGICLHDGVMYVADCANCCIRTVDINTSKDINQIRFLLSLIICGNMQYSSF